LRLLTLLYADDTVIFASSARDLQISLNNLSTYSKLWKLKVNIEKTKIMVFSRNGRYSKNMRFVYEEKKLEIVKEFKYLGVIFKNNGRFTSAVKHIKAQGNKAMRYVLWKTKSTDMPIDIKLKLYDTLVRPILLYGAEIWGFENSAILEKVELQYFKLLLNLRKSTPNYMIYGELGRLPISITIKTRLISFWGELIIGKNLNYPTGFTISIAKTMN